MSKRKKKVDTLRGRKPVLLDAVLHEVLKAESGYRKREKKPDASLEMVADEMVRIGVTESGVLDRHCPKPDQPPCENPGPVLNPEDNPTPATVIVEE